MFYLSRSCTELNVNNEGVNCILQSKLFSDGSTDVYGQVGVLMTEKNTEAVACLLVRIT